MVQILLAAALKLRSKAFATKPSWPKPEHHKSQIWLCDFSGMDDEQTNFCDCQKIPPRRRRSVLLIPTAAPKPSQATSGTLASAHKDPEATRESMGMIGAYF